MMLNQVIYFKRRDFQAPLLLSKVGRRADRYFSSPPLFSQVTPTIILSEPPTKSMTLVFWGLEQECALPELRRGQGSFCGPLFRGSTTKGLVHSPWQSSTCVLSSYAQFSFVSDCRASLLMLVRRCVPYQLNAWISHLEEPGSNLVPPPPDCPKEKLEHMQKSLLSVLSV